MGKPAPLGNNYGLKLKDPDVRQEAYQAYCDWIAKGKSSRSFTFEKDDLKCTGKTIESYIKDNPTEFPPINKEYSFCKGYSIWESICEESASGINEKANTASLQMVMRNKFGWDKKDEEKEEQDKDAILQKLVSQERLIAELQLALSKGQNGSQASQAPDQASPDKSQSNDQAQS